MKPLFNIVVTICLVVAATAHPENIEDVKQLPQTKEPVVEADEAQNHPRIERCSACAAKLHLNQPNFAALSQVGEVHTSQSFEGCSSENGCAGVKVKDGKVVEKFGNLDSFKNAISSDATKEFQFHAASALKNVFEKGIPGDGPFWWMNQNSPFKTSSSFQKYTSNSAYTSGSNDEGLSKNIFLNGQFAKGPSFNAGGANVNSGASSFNSGSANYHSSSSSFNSGSSSVNTASLSENPFLNGQLSSGFTGYTGSSPSPFTASTVGSNINLIQSSEKQYIQGASIDNGFANSGNVRPNENSGDLQQTCAGQGYVCVPRSQCNNGVVNTNGGYIPQANSQKQYCNVQREICCRVETTGTFGISTSSSGSSGFQTNIISGSSLDALSAGSALSETYRPGASGSNLKPGVPYLPPIDSTNSASNIVSSTRFPSTFLTTPRPVVSTLGYLPPSTSTAAPGYLPPQNPESTNQKETYVPPGPDYTTGSIYIDQFRQPSNPIASLPQAPSAVPAGCAAALKCTPIEYCTAEGVISNTTVSLTRDQASFRVPLTDCKDLETGRIGKCCRDPYYTDPWPVNQLGKWIPEAFGNTGKYVPDNGGSFSNRKIVVTSRPDTTGSTVLNVVRTSPTPITPSRIPVTTPKYQQIPGGGAYVQTEEGRYSQGGIGQYTETGGGSYLKQGVGQIGVGQIGVGVIGIKKGAQDSVSQGSFDIGTAVNKGIGTQYEKNNRYFTGQRNEITSGAGTIGVLGRGTQVTQGTYEEAYNNQGRGTNAYNSRGYGQVASAYGQNGFGYGQNGFGYGQNGFGYGQSGFGYGQSGSTFGQSSFANRGTPRPPPPVNTTPFGVGPSQVRPTPRPISPRPIASRPVVPRPVVPRPVIPRPIPPVTPRPFIPQPVIPQPITPRPLAPRPFIQRPVQVAPRPFPVIPRPIPVAPRPVPVIPRPFPVTPRPIPIAPRPIPIAPRPIPIAPRPISIAPRPISIAPRPIPIAPRPIPVAPRPIPVAPRPIPVAPRPTPVTPRPIPVTPRPIVSRPVQTPIVSRPVTPRPVIARPVIPQTIIPQPTPRRIPQPITPRPVAPVPVVPRPVPTPIAPIIPGINTAGFGVISQAGRDQSGFDQSGFETSQSDFGQGSSQNGFGIQSGAVDSQGFGVSDVGQAGFGTQGSVQPVFNGQGSSTQATGSDTSFATNQEDNIAGFGQGTDTQIGTGFGISGQDFGQAGFDANVGASTQDVSQGGVNNDIGSQTSEGFSGTGFDIGQTDSSVGLATAGQDFSDQGLAQGSSTAGFDVNQADFSSQDNAVGFDAAGQGFGQGNVDAQGGGFGTTDLTGRGGLGDQSFGSQSGATDLANLGGGFDQSAFGVQGGTDVNQAGGFNDRSNFGVQRGSSGVSNDVSTGVAGQGGFENQGEGFNAQGGIAGGFSNQEGVTGTGYGSQSGAAEVDFGAQGAVNGAGFSGQGAGAGGFGTQIGANEANFAAQGGTGAGFGNQGGFDAQGGIGGADFGAQGGLGGGGFVAQGGLGGESFGNGRGGQVFRNQGLGGNFAQSGSGSGNQGAGQFGARGGGFNGFARLVKGKYGTRQEVIQGIVTGTKTGEGFNITPGREYVVENEFGGRSEESINRVFLQKLSGDGQCGLLNPQKPYGNKNNLEVDFAEIPWQAMVLLQTNKSLLCGGVITRPDVVVTSAACVDGLQAKNVLIKGGEWKLGVDDEPLPFQIVQVKHILRHPFYKRGSYHFDAAILVLTENLRLAKNIQPICLPSKESSSLDAFYNGAGECLVTGWGKVVLQSHLQGSIMHAINVSLLNPGECQSKLSSDYPHLLEYYDSESCVCGQPTNPINSICKVDIGSALACTTGDSHFVLRGVYSWDSDCQIGNQIAAFYKFDIEWYEWALGFIDSVRFGAGITVIQKTVTTTITTSQYPNRFNNIGLSKVGGATGFSSVGGAADVTRLGTDQRGFIAGIGGGVKNTGSFTGSITSGGTVTSEVNRQYNTFGTATTGTAKQITGSSGVVGIKGFGEGVSGFTGQGQFSQGEQLTGQVGVPITNTYTFTEKKIFQTEPKYITYTTKPEIVTFTTKPEYYTFTTKPKYITYTTKPEIVTYTTKPKIITYTTKPEIVTYTTKPKIVTYTTKPELVSYEYQTLGSRTNLQYAAPDVSSNPSFTEIVNHKHTGQCKCLENSGKK